MGESVLQLWKYTVCYKSENPGYIDRKGRLTQDNEVVMCLLWRMLESTMAWMEGDTYNCVVGLGLSYSTGQWNSTPNAISIVSGTSPQIMTHVIGLHPWPELEWRLPLKVIVVTIDAQWEGMGDVGSARYEHYFGTASPMPDHKGFKLQ